jgi:hypothetical protein
MDGIAHPTTAYETLAQESFAQESCADENSDQFSRALGEAVIRIWGHLPNALQSRIFREAVTCQDVTMRPQLAVFLHAKHPRTAAAKRIQAIPEPDSLGG